MCQCVYMLKTGFLCLHDVVGSQSSGLLKVKGNTPQQCWCEYVTADDWSGMGAYGGMELEKSRNR